MSNNKRSRKPELEESPSSYSPSSYSPSYDFTSQTTQPSFDITNDNLIDVLANYPEITYDDFNNLYKSCNYIMNNNEPIFFSLVISPSQSNVNFQGMIISLLLLTFIFNTNYYYRMLYSNFDSQAIIITLQDPNITYSRLIATLNNPETLEYILDNINEACGPAGNYIFTDVINMFTYILQSDPNFESFFQYLIMDTYLNGIFNYPIDWTKLYAAGSMPSSNAALQDTLEPALKANVQANNTLEILGVVVSTGDIEMFNNNVNSGIWTPFLTSYRTSGQIANPFPVEIRRTYLSASRARGVPTVAPTFAPSTVGYPTPSAFGSTTPSVFGYPTPSAFGSTTFSPSTVSYPTPSAFGSTTFSPSTVGYPTPSAFGSTTFSPSTVGSTSPFVFAPSTFAPYTNMFNNDNRQLVSARGGRKKRLHSKNKKKHKTTQNKKHKTKKNRKHITKKNRKHKTKKNTRKNKK